MKPIAIIGAGITGLTAAFALKRRGLLVAVLEKAERAGGVIRSIRRDGFLAEFGPNTILETSPRISNLVRELGLEGRKQYTSPQAEARYIVKNGRPIRVPSSPIAFLTSSLFSGHAKWKLTREPFVPRRANQGEESVAAFVRRRLGTEFLERAIDAMVGGVYAGDPEMLSVDHAFPRLIAIEKQYGSLIKGQIFGARERKRRGEISKDRAPKFSFPEGLQEITGKLNSALAGSVRYGSEVQSVSRKGNDLVLNTSLPDASREDAHSAVLYAGTAFGLSELKLDSAERADLRVFSEIRYPPIASVVLGFRREDVGHSCEGFGMLVPGIEKRSILGTIFSSSLFPDRAPANHILLTTYVGGERNPQLALIPPSELVEMVLTDLRGLLGVKGKPVFQHTAFYPKAIPQYNVGYGKYLERMTLLEERVPGFFLAGHFRNGVSLSDSILSGLAVAERISDYLGKSSPTIPARPEQAANP